MNYSIMVEMEIGKWSSFYFKYCINFSKERHEEVLNKLNDYLKIMEDRNPYFYSLEVSTNSKYKEYYSGQINKFIKETFGKVVFDEYNKTLSIGDVKDKYSSSAEGHVLIKVLNDWANLKKQAKHKSRIQAGFKRNFLIFIRDCIREYGLCSYIRLRPKEHYEKFIVVLQQGEKQEVRFLISQDLLIEEVIEPYLQKQELFFNGRSVQFHKIDRIQVYKTLYKEDELRLLASKHRFVWSAKNLYYNLEYLLAELTNVTNKYVNARNHKNLKTKNIKENILAIPDLKISLLLSQKEIVASLAILQERKSLLANLSEDQMNDYLSDMLRSKGYYISDQTRSGYSSTRKNSGNLDIVIRNSGGNILSIIEGFILKSCGPKCPIARDHITKLTKNYNANGVKSTFAVAYCISNNFEKLYLGYREVLKDKFFKFQNISVETGFANIKVISSTYIENDERININHVLVNLK